MFTCIYVSVACAHHRGQKTGVRSPGTPVTDGHELPCEHWKLNLCLLQEQRMLLTGTIYPALQVSFNRKKRTTTWEGIFPSQVINQSHHMASSDRKCKSDLIILWRTERWPSSLSLYSVPDKIPVAGRHHPSKPQHSKHKSPHPSLLFAPPVTLRF